MGQPFQRDGSNAGPTSSTTLTHPLANVIYERDGNQAARVLTGVDDLVTGWAPLGLLAQGASVFSAQWLCGSVKAELMMREVGAVMRDSALRLCGSEPENYLICC